MKGSFLYKLGFFTEDVLRIKLVLKEVLSTFWKLLRLFNKKLKSLLQMGVCAGSQASTGLLSGED